MHCSKIPKVQSTDKVKNKTRHNLSITTATFFHSSSRAAASSFSACRRLISLRITSCSFITLFKGSRSFISVSWCFSFLEPPWYNWKHMRLTKWLHVWIYTIGALLILCFIITKSHFQSVMYNHHFPSVLLIINKFCIVFTLVSFNLERRDLWC